MAAAVAEVAMPEPLLVLQKEQGGMAGRRHRSPPAALPALCAKVVSGIEETRTGHQNTYRSTKLLWKSGFCCRSPALDNKMCPTID